MTRTAAAPAGRVPLAEDKIRVPRPGLAMLRRGRVTELMEAAAGRRVTVVTGPAGAGKTVACAAWASARPAARQPAWLTADARDAEPDRFWRYLAAALARSRAFGPDDAALLAAARPQDCPEAVLAAVGRLAEPVTLVIDDVHELAAAHGPGTEAGLAPGSWQVAGSVRAAGSGLAAGGGLAGLEELIRHAPAGLRLVLTGRSVPALGLARLRVAGEVADIGAAELACTPVEADGYLNMLGLALAPAERDELLERASGWMAGLRLAAMAARRDGRPAASPDRARAAVAEYVSDEVLAGQPPEVRTFLLRTSVTTSVSGELADVLAGDGTAGARMLDRLARQNALVEPAGPAEYRYHPMLREVLAAELRRERPGEVPGLLRLAARWHAGQGHPAEAIGAATEASDWELGAQIIAEAGAGLLDGEPGEVIALAAVLDRFPPEWRAGDARIAAVLAATRLMRGDAAGAAPHLECARRSLAALAPGTRHALLPWLTALDVMRAPCQPGAGPGWLAAEQDIAAGVEASAASVPGYRAAGLLWLAIGCARLRRHEIVAARHALGRAAAQLAVGSLPRLRARALAWQALAAASCGDLAAAAATIAEASQVAGAHDGDVAVDGMSVGPSGGAASSPAGTGVGPAGGSAAGVLALARAELALGRDDLDAARRHLDEADRYDGGRLAGEPPAAVIGGLIRARCALAEAGLPAARALLTRLAEASAASQLDLADLLAGLEADVALAAGERERAAGLLATAGLRHRASPEGQVRRARLALASGDDKGALKAAQRCLEQLGDRASEGAGSEQRPGSEQQAGGEQPGTVRDRISALLVAAVAHRRLSQVTEAGLAIEQALGLAEPDGAYRVFLDGGPAVRSAMTVLVPPTSGSAGFAGRVLERFDGQVPRHAAGPGHSEPPLTSSELAVLRFLPSHMTNQEIAEALFLSINTVKTHLRSAYRKLGVANRRQAIAAGRRLDLL
ncbi:MAG TPA: LuxR C-terminal-related transcriptional regulator [Streptosporangiaceae bacterium]|jgi:LuxR family maltose regulon positive regulatory protein